MAESEGPLHEFDPVAVDLVGEDHGDIGEVEGRGGDAEDGGGSLRRPDGDAGQADAEEDNEPNGVERGLRSGIDAGEEPSGGDWISWFGVVGFKGRYIDRGVVGGWEPGLGVENRACGE